MTPHPSQRGYFAAALHNQMGRDNRIVLLTGDLGYGMMDTIRRDFPDRFFNVGAAEGLLIGAAAGMALGGKIPFAYSITPFLLYRPFEWLRLYLNHEKIPVRLVGSGLDDDYKHDGFTHHAHDAPAVLSLLPNIHTYWPDQKEQVPDMVRLMVERSEPSFICLRR